MAAAGVNEQLRYEPQESCPPLLALTVGLQGVVLVLAPTVLIVAITVRAASQDEGYLTWAVFPVSQSTQHRRRRRPGWRA